MLAALAVRELLVVVLVLVVGDLHNPGVAACGAALGSMGGSLGHRALHELGHTALVVNDELLELLPNVIRRLLPANLLPTLDGAHGHIEHVGQVDLVDADGLAHRLEVGLLPADRDDVERVDLGGVRAVERDTSLGGAGVLGGICHGIHSLRVANVLKPHVMVQHLPPGNARGGVKTPPVCMPHEAASSSVYH